MDLKTWRIKAFSSIGHANRYIRAKARSCFSLTSASRATLNTAVSAHTEQIYLQYGVCVSYEEECSSSEMLKQGLSGAHLTIRTIRFYANLLLRFCVQDSRLHTASVQLGTISGIVRIVNLCST